MEKLDLHGLNVDEALSKTRSQIDWLVNKGGDILIINHGKGYHSEHGVGVVKQKVRALLKEMEPTLKEDGYKVIYGESDYPVALEYDAGCTLVVSRGRENDYLGGQKKTTKNQMIYSQEGKSLRKQQKKNRSR